MEELQGDFEQIKQMTRELNSQIAADSKELSGGIEDEFDKEIEQVANKTIQLMVSSTYRSDSSRDTELLVMTKLMLNMSNFDSYR